MDSLPESHLSALTTFLSAHPNIQHVPPSSPDFASLRATYITNPGVTPLSIIRPTTITDAATVVSFLAANSIPFTIRSGGHDMHGRSVAHQAVTLDLRRINYVHVDAESSTATIGGGTLFGEVVKTIQDEGFMTSAGVMSSVGYVGWAMYGGYGPYSTLYGLGVDQIVGARVITATGDVVDAGKDSELLKGIRGAGGAFGVVAEVTISLYKMDHEGGGRKNSNVNNSQILAGVLFYNSEDLTSVIRKFHDGYRNLLTEGLPAPLSVQQAVLYAPTGLTFVILLVWTSPDHATGQTWIEKISNLGPVAANTIQPTTPLGWLHEADKLVATSAQGRMWTVTLKRITDKIAKVIGEYMSKMPNDPYMLFDMHELLAESPSARPKDDSVFGAREAHWVVEIASIVKEQGNLERALDWAGEFREALVKVDPGNVLPFSYVSFVPKGEMDHGKVFGEDLEFLRALKARVDPKNVFKTAISYL